MAAKTDLHMHTIHSDGILSVTELLDHCAQRGLSTISITDHDSVEAFPEAIEKGSAMGIEVIVGVELSAWPDSWVSWTMTWADEQARTSYG